MTVIRVSQEAGGLSISVEGTEGSPTTIVLGARAAPLAIAGPPSTASAVLTARQLRSWVLGGLCFIVVAGLVTFAMGRHSANGANAISASVSAAPPQALPAPSLAYPSQGPGQGQVPSAFTSAFSQPPVVVPPPGAGAGQAGQANGAAPAPAAAPGSLFGLQP
jgi:hypothetical protein